MQHTSGPRQRPARKHERVAKRPNTSALRSSVRGFWIPDGYRQEHGPHGVRSKASRAAGAARSRRVGYGLPPIACPTRTRAPGATEEESANLPGWKSRMTVEPISKAPSSAPFSTAMGAA